MRGGIPISEMSIGDRLFRMKIAFLTAGETGELVFICGTEDGLDLGNGHIIGRYFFGQIAAIGVDNGSDPDLEDDI